MKPDPEPSVSRPREHFSEKLITFGIIALGSLLFSLKGVFAKLAYSYGSDPLQILTLRMAFALPFFATTWFITERRLGARFDRKRIKDLGQLALLGFIGYYASSVLDFIGLQYVSAGLERIILYSYPTIVLFLSARFLGQKISRILYTACALTWMGVALSFVGETTVVENWNTLALGTVLILLCAFTYAVFVILSSRMLKRIEATRFTSAAMTFSSIFVLSHYFATEDVGELFSLPANILGIGLFLALGGTVLPGYLMNFGLKRADPARFALISSIGPVTTVLAAFYLLGETPATLQWIGFLLTLGGGLAVALSKDKG